MLQSIREHSQGWIAWLIVGLISVPFALWGINSYLDGGSNVAVAKVNGTEIGLNKFQNAFQNYRDRLRQMLGDRVDIDDMDQAGQKQTVINGLIDEQLLEDIGHDTGMRIGDSQVANMIQTMDFFKDDKGQFSNALYEAKLKQSGINPTMYEEQLRRDLIKDQLREAVTDSTFVTEKEKQQIAKLQGQKRTIMYSLFSGEKLKDTTKIDDVEINDFYEKNKENYKTEESVKIKYIDLSVDELAKKVDVDEADLKEFYKTNIANYTLEERRVAQHVFIDLPLEATPEVVKKAEESAQKIYQILNSGVEFDDLPQKYASLLGAQDEVGKTGAVSEGVMEPEFDQVLFSLKVGELAKPVKSKTGFHIIKLAEIQEASVTTFEEAKSKVEQEYRHEQALAKFYDVADEMQNLVFENPDSLDSAADAIGFEVKQTDTFTRSNGEELTRYPAILKAAFDPKVIAGANSEPLELSDSRLIVLRAFDHKEPMVKELDLVREDIKSTILTGKLKSKTEEIGMAILAKLKEGEDPEKLAKDESFEWTKNENIGRDDPNVKRSVLRTVFKIGKPVENKPIYSGFTDGMDDYIVVAVTGVKDADIEWSGMDNETTQKAVNQLEQQRSTSAWQDFLAALRQSADIQINKDAL